MTQKITEIVQNRDLTNQLALNARKKAELFDWDLVKLDWKTFKIT